VYFEWARKCVLFEVRAKFSYVLLKNMRLRKFFHVKVTQPNLFLTILAIAQFCYRAGSWRLIIKRRYYRKRVVMQCIVGQFIQAVTIKKLSNTGYRNKNNSGSWLKELHWYLILYFKYCMRRNSEFRMTT
jgi:hypothetical protein